jgi:DNA-directed RNA polymerase beta' subunit
VIISEENSYKIEKFSNFSSQNTMEDFVDKMPVYDVASIEFGIYSTEEIRKMAVCKVDNIKPHGPGSVYDRRMGYNSDYDFPCPTCCLKKDCLGHFGYIDLAEPILHPMFYKHITSFLKCFCKKCYKILVKEEQLEMNNLLKIKEEKRFFRILEEVEKMSICIHCASPQPKIKFKPKDMIICMEYKQEKQKIDEDETEEKGKKGKREIKAVINLSADDIKKIFDNISDQDVELLGFDPKKIHPRNLILTALPVIPTVSRPYIISEGNICDDDLTHQYSEIVKYNNKLLQGANKEGKEADIPKKGREWKRKRDTPQTNLQNLRFRIQTMFVNTQGKAKRPTDSKPLKCIKGRLVGKGGRFRGNSMGKRVDFSARTVIGADPTLKLGEIGIPQEVARIHTKPEVVNEYNKEWLTKLMEEGKINYVITMKKRKNKQGTEVGTLTKTRTNVQLLRTSHSGTKLQYQDIIFRNCTEKFLRKLEEKKVDGKIVLPSKKKKITAQGIIIIFPTENTKLQKGDRILRNGNWVEIVEGNQKTVELKIGDTVERQIQDGDVGLLNRQPTLHRGSMMAMKLKIMPHKTFRLPLCVTAPFNADFDGDEMNLHPPQSYEAEAELRHLALAPHHIISAQESKPVIVITQDSLIASYLMTLKNDKLSKDDFMNILTNGETPEGGSLWIPEKVKHIRKLIGKGNFFTGRGLISMILPSTLNYTKENDVHPTEKTVKIVQGVFLEGALDKSTLGKAHGSIIQVINKEYGTQIVSNFIDNIQFLSSAWILMHGFSVGLQDCMITSKSSIENIQTTLAQCYAKAQGIEETTKNPGIREIRVTASLSQARDIGKRIAKNSMRSSNNFLTTVISGAKGDMFNIAQITGLLGQQNLEGHRVPPVLNHGTRTLPHYPRKIDAKEMEYESRGFIRNSFIHGLNPQEFFFHAMSGREGVADTAMSTAKSGYIQRKVVKVCEDIQVQNDQTVRDATGKIYEFVYGNNGYDPIKTINVRGKPATCDVSRLTDILNTEYENGWDDEESHVEDELKFTQENIKESDAIRSRKEKLIEKLRKERKKTIINENWTVEELTQRVQALKFEDVQVEEQEEDEEEIPLDSEEEKEEDNEEKDDKEEDEEDDKGKKKGEDDEDVQEDVNSDDDFEFSDEMEEIDDIPEETYGDDF